MIVSSVKSCRISILVSVSVQFSEISLRTLCFGHVNDTRVPGTEKERPCLIPAGKLPEEKYDRPIAWQSDLIYPVSGSCINVITAATTVL